jgi:hypothetical protein
MRLSISVAVLLSSPRLVPLIMVVSFSDSMQLTFAARDRLIAGASRFEAFAFALQVVGRPVSSPTGQLHFRSLRCIFFNQI